VDKKVDPSALARAIIIDPKGVEAVENALAGYEKSATERYSNFFVHVCLVHEGHFGNGTGKVSVKPKHEYPKAAKQVLDSDAFRTLLKEAASMYLGTGEQWNRRIRFDVFIYRHGRAGFCSRKIRLNSI
jgi:hypothetical protein